MKPTWFENWFPYILPDIVLLVMKHIFLTPYFFGYKKEFFCFQNNPKDLDPFYKMDLEHLDCLGRVKLVL